MPHQNVKASVHLSVEQRRDLEAICRRQSVGAARLRRARVLLLADEDHASGRRPDWQIAEVVGLSERQVVRIRQQFVREGEQVLDRKPRPSVAGKLDGKAEATLVTLCCSRPPAGQERWTLQLLCDELGRLQVVESVCRETVRKCLKKTGFNPGGRSGSAFRKRTERGSLRGWKKSSTSTKPPMTGDTR
jgi:hypothetical protein